MEQAFQEVNFEMEQRFDPFTDEGRDFWTGQLLIGIGRGTPMQVVTRMMNHVSDTSWNSGFEFGKAAMKNEMKDKMKSTKAKAVKRGISRKTKSVAKSSTIARKTKRNRK
jgi:hypothetical protein